jgi:hypothetical protein
MHQCISVIAQFYYRYFIPIMYCIIVHPIWQPPYMVYNSTPYMATAITANAATAVPWRGNTAVPWRGNTAVSPLLFCVYSITYVWRMARASRLIRHTL